MTGVVRILERPVRNSPLGVRFRDTVSGAVADDGLLVVAYPRRQPHRRVQGRVNRSGIYVFTDLPGVRLYEFGLEEPSAPLSPPAPADFVLEVTNPAGRFQPFLLGVTPPLAGLLRWEDPTSPPPGSPPAALDSPVPLFSAPTRPVPAGMAVVRAELRDRAGHAAAWAMLEVHHEGRLLGRSYADERGRVAMMFAYPEPLERVPGSPGGGARLPLAVHEWPVQISARYGRVTPVAGTQDPASPRFPDLRAVTAQPPAVIELDLSPPQPLSDPTLKYGRELVLRTRAGVPDGDPSGGAAPISHLVIAPALSPP